MSHLLCLNDPPVITHRPGNIPGLLMVAEHSGTAVPQALNNLGCDIDFSSVHFGCDIGVAGLMRELSALGVETFESNYSRAVLDPNRMTDDPTLIPAVQDGITILANAALSKAERQERIRVFYDGYHAPLDTLVEQRLSETPSLLYFSVHSMEKQLLVDGLGQKTDGKIRPRIAFLFKDKEDALADRFAAFYRGQGFDDVGMNIPYTAKDETRQFPMFLKHQPRMALLMIEIRNDLLRTQADIKTQASKLLKAIEALYLKANPPSPDA